MIKMDNNFVSICNGYVTQLSRGIPDRRLYKLVKESKVVSKPFDLVKS